LSLRAFAIVNQLLVCGGIRRDLGFQQNQDGLVSIRCRGFAACGLDADIPTQPLEVEVDFNRTTRSTVATGQILAAAVDVSVPKLAAEISVPLATAVVVWWYTSISSQTLLVVACDPLIT
jgi:hypothetical protein